MTKIVIDKALIEQAVDVINSECGYGGSNSYEPRAIAEALRAALAEPAVEPVAAQHRFRHPQKTMPGWSVWQPAKIDKHHPAWMVDSVGYEVEYRLLYTSPPPPAEPAHKLIYPGGGKSLFDKLWHLTCNAVATQSGMRVRTDVLPMIEMREFLHYLCALVDSPPSAPPAEVPLLDDKGILCMWYETVDRVPMCEHYKHFARAVEQAVRQKAGL